MIDIRSLILGILCVIALVGAIWMIRDYFKNHKERVLADIRCEKHYRAKKRALLRNRKKSIDGKLIAKRHKILTLKRVSEVIY